MPDSNPSSDPAAETVQIVFTPSGRRGRVARGTTVLEAARALAVDLDSVCGGRGICGRCQFVVGEGDFAKFGIRSGLDHLGPWAENETRFNDRRGLAANRRLGCSARILRDLVVDVPAESQIHRQIVRKAADHRRVDVDPAVALPDGPAYGIAVDVGSTTMAAQLCDLRSGAIIAEAGAMNPQIRFGEDVMSRVSFVQMNPERGGELTAAVRDSLARLTVQCAGQAGIDTETIRAVSLVGNPVMMYLLLGMDPTPLGQAPFELALDHATELPAAALELPLPAAARIYSPPCIAGHVGADAAAMILAEAPHQSDQVSLLVDVGTNAEIVLGNRHRLLACSSPTGPAFEGAQISHGQRATPGAIERVRINAESLEPAFKVIGCDSWSDEPDFVTEIGKTGVTGICGSGIIEAIAEMFLTRLITADGRVDGDMAPRTTRLEKEGGTWSYRLWDGDPSIGRPSIQVTQLDVRNIQLAKAAVYAGARLLMDRMGVDHVDRVALAGAFGSYIDPKYAMVLGLIPDCPLQGVRAAGNAAGLGARMLLLDRQARAGLEALVARVEKVETALEPGFQDHFVGAMAFPHKTDPFPNLGAHVQLPVPAAETRRRRRRGA